MGLNIPSRKPDWPVQLSAYLTRAENRTFRYGRWDCALFVAGAVRAMTGFDPAYGLRGYSGKAGAASKLDELGISAWPDLVADRRIDPAEMRVGDIAAIGDDLAGAVCVGAQLKVLHPMSGIGLVPRSAVAQGFKI
ncbi:DUF6950 family protein [Tateyamaria sp.]|uniref:DUF6950 family protein n=1 Tax=Tateyamaria sp. TaxID=1929288 RepID=UPI003B224C9C